MIGAGQLARMTHQAAIALGQSLRVLAVDPGEPAALVCSDVRPGGARCTLALAVAGHGSVPSSLLGDSGTLVVHRLHREALHVRGIDTGEVRFDFSRTVSYTRLPSIRR